MTLGKRVLALFPALMLWGIHAGCGGPTGGDAGGTEFRDSVAVAEQGVASSAGASSSEGERLRVKPPQGLVPPASEAVAHLQDPTDPPGASRAPGEWPELSPEWVAALQHPDPAVRLMALDRWAEQGAAMRLEPLTQALVDPDEQVRAWAQGLVEYVWAAEAEE